MSRYCRLIAFAAAGTVFLVSCTRTQAPDVPSIDCSPWSMSGDTVEFVAMADDPDMDNVAYRFAWGSGDTSAWTGYVLSGTPVVGAYVWDSSGTRQVRAQAMDDWAAESEWSVPARVHVLAEPGYPNWILETVTLECWVSTILPSPDGAYCYLIDRWDGVVWVMRTEDYQVVDSLLVGGEFACFACSPDGEYLYYSVADTVMAYSRSLGLVVDTVVVNGSVTELAVAPDGERLYVVVWGETEEIVAIDLASMAVVLRRPVEWEPAGLAVHPNGLYVYLCDYDCALLYVLNAGDLTVQVAVPVPGYCEQVVVSPDGEHVYVLSGESEFLAVVRTADNTIERIVYIEDCVEDFVVYPSGEYVFVVNEYADLLVFETESFVQVEEIRYVDPNGLGVLPDGSRLYVLEDDGLTVLGFDE